MVRVKERLLVVVPLTLILIVGLLYRNARSIVRTSIVLLAVPLFAIGAFWFLYLLAPASEVHDSRGDDAGLGTDHDVGRHGIQRDEAHRRAARRRDPGDLSAAISDLGAEFRSPRTER
jgi:copper/silver efflux system protein